MPRHTRILIDGPNMAHRMRHALQLTSPSGRPVSVLYGMIQSIRKMISELDPACIVVAWDGLEGSKARRLVYPQYKEARIQRRQRGTEEEKAAYKAFCSIQIPDAMRALNYLGIPQPISAQFEADDLIAVFARDNDGFCDTIVSTDKDMLQLARANRCRILNPVTDKMFYEDTRGRLVMNGGQVIASSPRTYLWIRAIAGDDSDSIRGIERVGEIIADKLLHANPKRHPEKSATLDDHISYIKRKIKDNKRGRMVLACRDIIWRNLALMCLERSLPARDVKRLHDRVRKFYTGKTTPIFLRSKAHVEGSAFLQYFRAVGFGMAFEPTSWPGFINDFRAVYRRSQEIYKDME